MRWIWIDTFVEFHSGKSARAVKNLSLAEDYFAEHFPHLVLGQPRTGVQWTLTRAPDPGPAERVTKRGTNRRKARPTSA